MEVEKDTLFISTRCCNVKATYYLVVWGFGVKGTYSLYLHIYMWRCLLATH